MNNKLKIYLLACFILIYVAANTQTDNITDSLKIELSLADNEQKKIEIMYKLAKANNYKNSELSYSYIKKAIDLNDKRGDTKFTVKLYLLLSDYHWKRSENSLALEYSHKAKDLAKKFETEKEYADAILKIANIYTVLGDFSKNSELFFQALGIYEKLNDKKATTYALSSIAGSYFEQENLDKALEYSLQSLSLSREINNLNGISRSLSNLGILYGNLKDYKKQVLYNRESIRIKKMLGSDINLGITYLNIGDANSKLLQFDTSFYYYNKALQIFEQFNNVQLVADIHLLLSQNYLMLNKTKLGMKYAQKALQIGKEHQLLKVIHRSYQVLHELYNAEGDMDRAYQYSLLHYQLKDSLDLETTLARLSQTETKYKFDKILEENKNKQKLKEYKYTIVSVVSVSVFLLLIFLLVFRYKIRMKNNLLVRTQLESDLEIKNKELASNAMAILKTNEVLSEIADSLMKIRNEAVKEETKSAIKKIAGKIKRTTKTNIWEEFEMRFQQVHSGFYDNLIEKFPGLTPNELRLCALLRLNLTNKEISELTGQRTTSLEIARTRLRKKLGITDRKISLVIFLSDI